VLSLTEVPLIHDPSSVHRAHGLQLQLHQYRFYPAIAYNISHWKIKNKVGRYLLSPTLRSNNHRMLGVGRDLCGSSSPTPLPKQGHLQQAAQDRIQVGLEYLQRRRLHNLPGQPALALSHPQSEEVLPHVQLELPLLPCVPIAPCPVAGHQ